MAFSESVEEQSHFGPETHRRLEVVPVGLTSVDVATWDIKAISLLIM